MDDADGERPIIPTGNDETNIAFNDYSLALGRVVHSWNRLHERLAELFAAIGGEREIPVAVWYSSMNDRAQRNMLSAAIEATQSVPDLSKRLYKPRYRDGLRWDYRFPGAKDDLRWILNEINSLAQHRDNAVHAPVHLIEVGDHMQMAATTYTQHNRAKNLIGKELLIEFDYYERRSDSYLRFVEDATGAVLYAHFPWPERPSLPNRRPGKPGGLV